MLSMPRIVRPDPSSVLRRNLVPPLDRQPCRSVKRNKELPKVSYLTNPESSQAAILGNDYLASGLSFAVKCANTLWTSLLPRLFGHWLSALSSAPSRNCRCQGKIPVVASSPCCSESPGPLSAPGSAASSRASVTLPVGS